MPASAVLCASGRPAWRGTKDAAFIARQRAFNGWLRSEAPRQSPPMGPLDTMNPLGPETADAVGAWIGTHVLASIFST
jgi:hypothetical protein